MRRWIDIIALALAFGWTVPAAAAPAEFLPSPHLIASPDERSAVEELSRFVAERVSAAQALPRLDRLLTGLTRPTRMRGLVQFMRGAALEQLERHGEAREAIQESVRLLPGYSGPLLFAGQMEAYSDRPEAAADYFLRVGEIDPDRLRQIPDYELDNLPRRLAERDDHGRRRQLAERLFAIGWLGESLALRSALALELIKAKAEAGDLAGARAQLPRLMLPGHARELLMQRRYEALWSDVEQWAGPRQERLWGIYLAESRAAWRASRDRERALDYVRALQAANHQQTVVDELLPLFTEGLERGGDYELIWTAAPLADALARLGRWSDIERMYARAAQVWPLGLDANALNIAANRARFRLLAGDAAAAVREMDAAIADAGRHGGEVSAGALASMHHYRACALHQLDRDAEAIRSMELALQQSAVVLAAALHLCFERPDAARDLLIEALGREAARDAVIAFVQPVTETPIQSEYGRTMAARYQALRNDPRLLAEVSRYGRVLPYPASAGAPPEAPAESPRP